MSARDEGLRAARLRREDARPGRMRGGTGLGRLDRLVPTGPLRPATPVVQAPALLQLRAVCRTLARPSPRSARSRLTSFHGTHRRSCVAPAAIRIAPLRGAGWAATGARKRAAATTRKAESQKCVFTRTSFVCVAGTYNPFNATKCPRAARIAVNHSELMVTFSRTTSPTRRNCHKMSWTRARSRVRRGSAGKQEETAGRCQRLPSSPAGIERTP